MKVLADNGTLRAALAAGPEELNYLSEEDGSPSRDLLIRGDTLVLAVDPRKSSQAENNALVGWSMTTGKRL